VPIYLIELSPIAFRTFVVGTSYHLGVLAACASNTMLTAIAEGYPVTNATQGYPVTPNVAKGPIYNYGYVMCTFMGGVFAFVILVLLIGTEHRRRSMTATDEISGRLAYVLNIPTVNAPDHIEQGV
jgi:SHS family lactate transporter-like MFS transporter